MQFYYNYFLLWNQSKWESSYRQHWVEWGGCVPMKLYLKNLVVGQIWPGARVCRSLFYCINTPWDEAKKFRNYMNFLNEIKDDGNTIYPTSSQPHVVCRSEATRRIYLQHWSAHAFLRLKPFKAHIRMGLAQSPAFFPSLILSHCHIHCAVQPRKALNCFLISYAESCPHTFAGAAPLLRRLPLPLANSYSLSEALFKRLCLDVSPESISWVNFPSFLFPPHAI